MVFLWFRLRGEGGREWSTLPACACACLFGRSLPLSSSKIVPSLARSLTTTRLPSLPPSLSLSAITRLRPSVDPRGSRCQVGCRLSTRAMGDSRRSDISTCHKREAAVDAAAAAERPLLLALHSSAELMVIGKPNTCSVSVDGTRCLLKMSEVAYWQCKQFQRIERRRVVQSVDLNMAVHVDC